MWYDDRIERGVKFHHDGRLRRIANAGNRAGGIISEGSVPMELKNLEGLAAILLTPFTADGKIDEAGVKHLVRAAIDKGLNGVVVLGSNSEFPYLRFEEKVRVMGAAAEAAAGKIPVIGTASAWSTEQALDLAREAGNAGCNAVMAALPLYFRLDFKDAVKHFDAIAGQGGLPVYYYHFPDVTGLAVPPRDLARIAEIDGVIGAKITVVNRGFLKKTIQAAGKHKWKVFTGTSFLLYDCLEFGGAGAFCPLPLIGSEDVKAVYEAFKSGDLARAKTMRDKLLRAIPLFTGARLPPALLARGFKAMVRMPYRAGKRAFASHGLLKEALRLQGHPITSKVRRPYQEVNPQQHELVKRTLEDLGWL
ncbi:MAG TPA: dihydrodipicolinate synthase family protein [bacterium]|nr:dihydrodipicolinate synthase family protein [bacterium]